MSELRVTTLKHAAAAADNITLDANGNVGIGTSSPGSRLDARTSGATVARFQSTAVNGGYMTYVGGSTTYIGASLAMLGTGTASDFAIIGSGTNNLILGTSSSEKMRIDSAGRVTMPYQPSFAASLNTGNTAGNSADIAFNLVRHNIGNHYNSGSGYFTAPVAGVYSFNLSVMSNNAITQNNVHYLIMLNGAELQHSYSSSGGGFHHKWNWNGHIQLNANDTININTAGFQMYGGDARYSWFSGHLLG